MRGHSNFKNLMMLFLFISLVIGQIRALGISKKIYWTDLGAKKIKRSNPDGSEIEDIITRGLISPHGIAMDSYGEKIYWTDVVHDKIRRANLDG
jgi:sugar lactone lactonase YvrE